MNLKRLIPLLAAYMGLSGVVQAQQVYKWTDASGQVHYSQQKPGDAPGVQALEIAPPPPAQPSNPDADAEIARIKALSEHMARERQAAEQARQDQAIRDLELQNKALENTLLNQQIQQQQQPPPTNDRDSVIIGYPPFYPDPPYPPGPPDPPPCRPWPACHKSRPAPLPGLLPLPTPMPMPRPPEPLVKPHPPFKPAPDIQGGFRGR